MNSDHVPAGILLVDVQKLEAVKVKVFEVCP
jgi:hypothetical protein